MVAVWLGGRLVHPACLPATHSRPPTHATLICAPIISLPPADCLFCSPLIIETAFPLPLPTAGLWHAVLRADARYGAPVCRRRLRPGLLGHHAQHRPAQQPGTLALVACASLVRRGKGVERQAGSSCSTPACTTPRAAPSPGGPWSTVPPDTTQPPPPSAAQPPGQPPGGPRQQKRMPSQSIPTGLPSHPRAGRKGACRPCLACAGWLPH